MPSAHPGLINSELCAREMIPESYTSFCDLGHSHVRHHDMTHSAESERVKISGGQAR